MSGPSPQKNVPMVEGKPARPASALEEIRQGKDWRILLSKIRHELRTPINHIVGYSEMLAEEAAEVLPADSVQDLLRIRSGGRQLLDLIQHYFADDQFTDLTSDLHRLCHELRTPVNQILGYAELVQEEANERGIRQYDSDLDRIRRAARSWLERMESYLAPESGLPRPEVSQTIPEAGGIFNLQQELALPRGKPVGTSATVLVVDDDDANRELLRRRLIREGCLVRLAPSAENAFALLEREKIDLILLDMLMPDVDGFEFLRRLKKHETLRHVPVIMISSLDHVDGVARCIELGAEDYLTKPFNPAFLRARVSAALEKKRLRDMEQFYLRQIRIEQEKSDRLLSSILPASIAARLKQSTATIADSFSEATVLFADLAGFTSLATTISAHEVVGVLNEIFSAFDSLVEKHQLEKIKTTGDAYMAAGGIPSPRPDHAAAMADLALDMLDELGRFNLARGTSLGMRIGINTGPVIAGVIGRSRFIYDLWGDTVNTASRMEAHSSPGRILVTEETRQRLRSRFRLRKRPAFEVKGKGLMVAYWLKGRKGL